MTYHVVGQKIIPADLGAGDFKTLEGNMVMTSGPDQSFKINGTASVICGKVQTRQRHRLHHRQRLMPPAK